MSTPGVGVSERAGPDRMPEPVVVCLEQLGELVPVGRPGGQGRVWRPIRMPAALAAAPIVVKLYRRPLSADAGRAALVAAVVFFLVLSRLFAASVNTGGSPTAPGGASANGAPQYYVPVGPGTDGGFR